MAFVTHVRKVSRDNGIKTYFPTAAFVLYDGEPNKLGGFFCPERKVLACACKVARQATWLGIMANEYSHLEQWLDGTYPSVKGSSHPEDVFWTWLQGVPRSQHLLLKALDYMKKLEIDCERRTVKNIVKYHLPINLDKYKKQAEAYIHAYNIIQEMRSWPLRGPTEYYKIYGQLPGTLRGAFKTTPRNIGNLIKDMCY